MIWTSAFRKNKNFQDKLLLIIPSLIIFVLIVFLVYLIVKDAKKPFADNFYPEQIINIDESFSGVLHFNDVLGLEDFSNLIVDNIDAAQDSIDMAMYSMDSVDIKMAIFRAAQRGVRVNLIFSDKHEIGLRRFFQDAPSSVNILYMGRSVDQIYMHHKFLIIDRGHETQKLFFGSYNFTDIQGKFDPSFILETKRPEIIDIFGKEIDRLSSQSSWSAKHHQSYNPFVALINYPEGYLEIWFTPESGINSLKARTINIINQAKQGAKALIWHLTDRDIAATLVSASKKIPTIILADDFNFYAPESMLPIMLSQKNRQNLKNLEILHDANRDAEVASILRDDSLNSFLHHHTLLVDSNIVIFGTNNWSYGGFKQNDESIMISSIPYLIDGFYNSFELNYQIAR